MKQMIALTALLALAACQLDRDVPDPTPMPPQMACVPDQTIIGQPSSVLAAMTFPQGTRIFNTGDALTMDFRADRLNIEIGPAGLIVAVTCG